eukprot:1161916-Pelagomonas_calceolata.AAC.6
MRQGGVSSDRATGDLLGERQSQAAQHPCGFGTADRDQAGEHIWGDYYAKEKVRLGSEHIWGDYYAKSSTSAPCLQCKLAPRYEALHASSHQPDS